jgi:hypothetical protein
LPLCLAIRSGAFVRHSILREEAPNNANEWDIIEPMFDRVATQCILAERIDCHPEANSKSSPFGVHKTHAAPHSAKKRFKLFLCDKMSTHRPPKSRISWGLGRIDDPRT